MVIAKVAKEAHSPPFVLQLVKCMSKDFFYEDIHRLTLHLLACEMWNNRVNKLAKSVRQQQEKYFLAI